MLRPVLHRESDAKKAVGSLTAVPALRVAFHGAADAPVDLGHGGRLRVGDLLLRPPFVRGRGVTAKRTEDFLVAHLVAPVVFVHLELTQALG